MVDLHIGFDDTDSPRGGCTTYIAALLVEKLQELDATFKDYPNLIRLNPNVPWKTRGNGALCLRIACNRNMIDTILETVVETVEKNSDIGFKDTDPGIVFCYGADIPKEIRAFAKRTIQGIVRLNEALELIKKFEAEALGFGTGYGIVGALAAVGETLDGDYTYEAIAYRIPENRGRQRLVNSNAVKEMNEQTAPQTFNNIDPETQRILITPRGPDPILYGIRGETPEAVVRAHKMIQASEPVERWVVFRTNHGTDAHLEKVKTINGIQPYHPVVARGTVASLPELIPKRHRVFSIRDETGKVDCAAYEPTGALRKVAAQLVPGDKIEVYGGVRPATARHPLTINLEKLRIIKLSPEMIAHNPRCPRCSRRTKSMGTSQGFRCPKCGFRSSSLQKILVEKERGIKKGLFIASLRSQRHLTKPLSRYGKEKIGKPKKMRFLWHS